MIQPERPKVAAKRRRDSPLSFQPHRSADHRRRTWQPAKFKFRTVATLSNRHARPRRESGRTQRAEASSAWLAVCGLCFKLEQVMTGVPDVCFVCNVQTCVTTNINHSPAWRSRASHPGAHRALHGPPLELYRAHGARARIAARARSVLSFIVSSSSPGTRAPPCHCRTSRTCGVPPRRPLRCRARASSSLLLLNHHSVSGSGGRSSAIDSATTSGAGGSGGGSGVVAIGGSSASKGSTA